MRMPGRLFALLIGCVALTAAASALAHDRAGQPEAKTAEARKPVVKWRVEQHRRGFLGVHLVRLTESLRAHFGAPRDAGVMVGEVEADSPAAKATIAVGDIIIAVAGQAVDTPQAAARQVARHQGEAVAIKVIRQKQELTLQATPEPRVQRAVTRQRWAIGDDDDGDREVEVEIEGDMEELIDRLADEVGRGPAAERYTRRRAELDQRLQELDAKLKQLDAAIERLEQAKAAR